jgi:hypothetical protein
MKKGTVHTIIFFSAILLLPLIIYTCNFRGHVISDDAADWGTFGDYVGGVLGPYISLLTLIVTAVIAYILYHYETKRDSQVKQEQDVKSFMELYQFFISAEFREVRVVAWYILKKAVYNDDYKNFVVNENYVSRYINRIPRADIYTNFSHLLYQNDHPGLQKPVDEGAFLRQEALDRNMVDTLINFFQLLSIKEVPKGYFKVCDFYYDTWRPVLYWYAKELESAYSLLAENKKYNNAPTLTEALKKLDSKFYESQVLSALNAAGYSVHPIIQHMKSGKP